eukprot:GFUD01121943.1.p1 GENE.GFUD01121943.1~~GFUD01121943.1.p1  ORF type:complete len:357 (+),score=75.82 GFUD01121943.1:46-1116(+)
MIMLPMLHSVSRTMRIFSPTILQSTNYLHTSNCCKAMAKEVKKKEEKIETSSLRLAKVSKTSASRCSIMKSEDHRMINKVLGKDFLIDIVVGHILGRKIKVHKVALESNITIFKENLRVIKRHELPENLSPELKVGRFTIENDEIIKHNWNKLITELNLKEQEVIKEIFEKTDKNKDFGLKKNVIGYFLSQGFSEVRLATEVFQRARILLCAKRGYFSPEEDKTILDFVDKEGKKWTKLSILLGRTSGGVLYNRYNLLTASKDNKCGPFTVDEDKLIIREVFAVSQNILEEGNVVKEDWETIGKKLQRNSLSVHSHWKYVLEPMLKRYEAGTLNIDMRKGKIIEFYVSNIMNKIKL